MLTNNGSAPCLGRVGLALSGGGSRAIAFHLGCLRALQRAGILEQIAAISSVSGGSVIAAMYCSHQGSFDEFEKNVRHHLSRGFLRESLVIAFTTVEGIKAVSCFTILIIERSAAILYRVIRIFDSVKLKRSSWPLQPAFIRRASRTTILRAVFREIFANATLADLGTSKPELIIIACELRAKAAFYFTAKKLHCWRYGSSEASKVQIADAVVASAAYPLALPALDLTIPFEMNGEQRDHRITLTDGGVYDNLGLAPLWPGRDVKISLDCGSFDRIIACRAGYALEVGEPASTFPSRMAAAFECTFARAQNLAMNRLFDLQRAGKLKGFLLPYLGQKDSEIMDVPNDFITADSVTGYPTNFKAMDLEWIDKLSLRGDQLVTALLRQYWKEFLPSDV